MSQHNHQDLTKALIYFVLWLISFAGLAMLYVQYRTDNTVELLGQRWDGNDALIVILCVALIPVTLLAKAAQHFFKYREAAD